MELCHTDVSEGSSKGPQTNPDKVSVTVVVPSSGSESTFPADLDINPEVELNLS